MKTEVVLIFALFAVHSMCLFIDYNRVIVTDPAGIYPLNLTAGQTLRVEVNWTKGATNMDIYLYKYGVDFLSSNTYIGSATSLDD